MVGQTMNKFLKIGNTVDNTELYNELKTEKAEEKKTTNEINREHLHRW